jgi:hypothetical protein
MESECLMNHSVEKRQSINQVLEARIRGRERSQKFFTKSVLIARDSTEFNQDPRQDRWACSAMIVELNATKLT